MERYDSIIIGNGPAGLSAALTLKIRNKNILILANSNTSNKVENAHEINNYLGLPNIKGSDLSKAFISHIDSLGIKTIVDSVTAVYSMGDYFSIQTKSNSMYEAKTVILASGVNFGKPYIGEKEFLGKGVSYCATCDAMLYKNKNVVVIGQTEEAENEANFLSEVASKVTYIPLYKETKHLNDSITIINDTVCEIKGAFKANKIVLKNSVLDFDGIFILRESIAPDSLIPGLVLEGAHVNVNRKMQTNLSGVFACGDITGTPYQYIKAAGEGNVAAINAVDYLSKLK